MAAAAADTRATASSLAELLGAGNWLDTMRTSSQWAQRGAAAPPAAPVPPVCQAFWPHACNACKRGAVTDTALRRCSKCRMVQYCGAAHQVRKKEEEKKKDGGKGQLA